MDENDIDVLLFLTVFEELFEFRPVCRSGRFSFIDKIIYHFPALTLGIFFHGFELGRDGKFLLGLFVRGYTGVKKAVHGVFMLVPLTFVSDDL